MSKELAQVALVVVGGTAGGVIAIYALAIGALLIGRL